MLARPPDAATNSARVPAWLLSLAAHCLLLTALALMLRSPPAHGMREPDRDVDIVLATRVAPDQTEYYDESDAQLAAKGAEGSPPLADSLPQLNIVDAALSAMLPTAGPLSAPAASSDLAIPGAIPRNRPRILPGLGDEAILANDPLYGKTAEKSAPRTAVSLFGSAPARGRSFVFVIDRSKSMGSSGLDVLRAAERELGAALANLTSEHRFQIIAYHQQLNYFERGVLSPATPENKKNAVQYVGQLLAIGGTAHLTAILAAVRLEPDVVFLLTDGDDPALTSRQIRRVLDEARGTTTIFCVEFGRGKRRDDESDFMQRLAHETGGDYRYIDRSR